VTRTATQGEAAGVGGEKTRVLLVDDHPVLRQGMAAMINEEPDLIVCGEADGVQAALDAAHATRPHVAVVDLSIRGGDGIELIRSLRDQCPAVRCLVLSMFDEAVYAERALRAGARGYVMKAEVASNVIEGIRSVLRGELYVSPEVRERVEGARPGAAPAAGVSRLSDRELQVLRCVGRGMSTREVAQELFISVKTVEAHREHLKQKLELADSNELLRYAIEYNRLNG